MKLKIALIVSNSPGQLTYFGNMAQILSKKYEVHLYLLPQMPKFLSGLAARFFALLTKQSSTYSRINNNSKLIMIPRKAIARIYLFMLSFYISLKYDIVMSHDIHWPGAISTLCAKFFRKKSIIFIVGNYVEEINVRSGRIMYKLLSILEFISIHLADIIIAPDYITKYFKEKGTKAKIVEKTIRVVDAQQFKYDDKVKKKYRKKIGIPNSDPVLLFIGWLTEHDGADIALDIYRALSKENKNLWLIFIGSGVLEEYIKKAITEENLQKVILTGFVPHSEIHNYMMAGDIGLMPLREPQCGVGQITLELMALGIPIIAADVGSLREVIIDYETGFIVKKDIIWEATQKIKFLIPNPDLINKIRINARKMVEEDFSQESISARVFSLIDTCMDS